MSMKSCFFLHIKILFLMSGLVLGNQAFTAELEPWQLAEKTEVWTPVPAVVDAPEGKPSADAIVLFTGKNQESWESVNGGKAQWDISNGALIVKAGAGDIRTRQSFCDIQLHIEWQAPLETEGLEGQQRGNSGVFFRNCMKYRFLTPTAVKRIPTARPRRYINNIFHW